MWFRNRDSMSSWNGNAFRIIGPWKRDHSIDHRWIPLSQKASDTEFWCFLYFINTAGGVRLSGSLCRKLCSGRFSSHRVCFSYFVSVISKICPLVMQLHCLTTASHQRFPMVLVKALAISSIEEGNGIRWRHDMETLPELLALCVENPPVIPQKLLHKHNGHHKPHND